VRVCRQAKSSFDYVHWTFASTGGGVCVSGEINADREAFVGLAYSNPPGGTKHCLNTKIASARMTVTDGRLGTSQVLTSRHGALFEILTDDREHCVQIRA
jgi:hypothetical protein